MRNAKEAAEDKYREAEKIKTKKGAKNNNYEKGRNMKREEKGRW